MTTKWIALTFSALTLMALVPHLTAGSQEPPADRTFTGTYTLALGWSNDAPVALSPDLGEGRSLGAMAAVVTCSEDASGFGGACAPESVDQGDVVDVTVQDVQAPEVRFMACVDGDSDGVCRPEFPADRLYIEPCDDGDNTLIFTHDGPSGVLDVYLLNGIVSRCVPFRGTITGTVHPRVPVPPQCSDLRDNDGNGFIDWPSDPGCSGPTDPREWSPQCSNLKDDDRDGAADWPNDPDCSGPTDNSESPVRAN